MPAAVGRALARDEARQAAFASARCGASRDQGAPRSGLPASRRGGVDNVALWSPRCRALPQAAPRRNGKRAWSLRASAASAVSAPPGLLESRTHRPQHVAQAASALKLPARRAVPRRTRSTLLRKAAARRLHFPRYCALVGARRGARSSRPALRGEEGFEARGREAPCENSQEI